MIHLYGSIQRLWFLSFSLSSSFLRTPSLALSTLFIRAKAPPTFPFLLSLSYYCLCLWVLVSEWSESVSISISKNPKNLLSLSLSLSLSKSIAIGPFIAQQCKYKQNSQFLSFKLCFRSWLWSRATCSVHLWRMELRILHFSSLNSREITYFLLSLSLKSFIAFYFFYFCFGATVQTSLFSDYGLNRSAMA